MMGFGFGGIGWLSMLVFWVAIIALAVWVLGKLFLEVKQEALDRIDTLEERVASLCQSLRRIDTLRDELATREAEFEASIHGNLLNG